MSKQRKVYFVLNLILIEGIECSVQKILYVPTKHAFGLSIDKAAASVSIPSQSSKLGESFSDYLSY